MKDNIEMLTGAILAGGENRRFPTLKGFLKIDGVTIIEKNIHLLKSFCNEIIISTNKPELYCSIKLNMYGDIFPLQGPMSGIYSLLINAKYDNLLIIACDMPFVSSEVIALIIKKHLEVFDREDYYATIPIFNNKLQPLCGIYNRKILPLLEDHLVKGKNSIYLFLKEINVNIINEYEIKKIDHYGQSFVNINTISDYEMIKERSIDIAIAI